MVRNALILVTFATFFIGPFAAIAAVSLPDSFSVREGKSASCFIGIACSQGPIILPALSRMK